MTDPRPDEREPATRADPAGDAAGRLAALWQRGRGPALEAFLAGAGPLAPAELAAVLRVDQRRRWEAGERVPAESYLERYPALRGDPEAELDLIYAEYLLHERHGERPDAEAFLGRFPGHRDALKPQVDLHLALDAATAGDPSEFTRSGGGPEAETWRPWPAGPDCGEHPRELGRYRIEALLGQGGMGRVYRAVDTKLGRPVALKVPGTGRHGDWASIQRFFREARVASTFNHPNLCPIFDLGEHEGVHYLTMPLLAGETLAARLARDGPLPAPEAAALAAKIARAMQVAHEAGVLHRDLKPANIMIDPDGEPVVMDFGLARRPSVDDVYATAPGVLMGTLAYISPEQVGGDPAALGPSCDIYSLGVILYQMLAGRVPFCGPPHTILAQIVARNPDPPSRHRPGLNPRLERITMRALVGPDAPSFSSMAELAEELEDWRERDIDAPTPTPPAPRPQSSTRRLWAWSAAATIAALVAFAAYSARRPAPAGPGALLTAGSRWAGTFRFRPPITDYTGDVEILVGERRGESFRALYTTEAGAYQWRVEGTVRGADIRWSFVEAVRDNREHNVVGKAYVEGRIEGPRMKVVFFHPGGGDADMELRLEP